MARGIRLRVGLVMIALTATGCVSPDSDESGGTSGEERELALVDEGNATSPSSDPSTSDSALTRYAAVVAEATVDNVVAYQRPDVASPVVAEFENPTSVGGPLVFTLVDNRPPEVGQQWVQAQLPIRPNGTTGWVRADQLSMSLNPYRIEIDPSKFELQVYRSGELWLSTTVAIGTGSTPTPRGEFYITELLQPPNPDGLYGPYAFGLSGFSETLDSFNGGDGVIGLHGTDEPDRLGTEVSHGCVRLANDVITELAAVIPLGTPVIISE